MAYTSRIQINYDKVYNSNSCGQFKIIKDLGRDERSRLYVRIKFIDTGTEKDVRYDLAMDGRIRDDLYGIDFSKIYHSNYYGDFKILHFVGRNNDSKKMVRIKFINTGYEYDVALRLVLRGDVKDYSVDYKDRQFNYSNYNTAEYDAVIIKILSGRWKAMMSRCYNTKDKNYCKYGFIGVRVEESWHNFQNYLIDIKTLKNYDKFYYNPAKYQIDKDYLQLNIPPSQKIYSKNTCVFLSDVDNANLGMLEKHIEGEYYGIRQQGNEYIVTFSVKGKRFIFGKYSNLYAALSMYDFYYRRCADYELIPLLNTGFRLMPVEEAELYKTSK